MDKKFNEEFFESEYEYDAHSGVPFERTEIDLGLDKTENSDVNERFMTEEERMM